MKKQIKRLSESEIEDLRQANKQHPNPEVRGHRKISDLRKHGVHRDSDGALSDSPIWK